MSRKKIHILILSALAIAFLSFAIGSENTAEKPVLDMVKIEVLDIYTAGESIELKLKEEIPVEMKDSIWMYISSSYGSTLIYPELVNQQWLFKIPSEISDKSGHVLWKLHSSNHSTPEAGTFHITPNPANASVVESYLGPQTIVAGELDFSMMVIAATDIYDNLVPNNTPVTIQTYGGNSAKSYSKITKDRIAWERIFSPKKSGRMIVSGTSNFASTNEKTLDISPNNATDFSITEQLVHPYADGNQIAVFITSAIKDEFNNTVSDGTLVHFNAITAEGEKMQVSGTTINGVATGQFLHPKKPTSWKVEAFVYGLAKSTVKEVSFLSVIQKLNVLFSENNRTITVGPITSYMGQLIPDGAQVILNINEYDRKVILTSKNGMVTFKLNPAIYFDGPVTMKIETMGISKTFEKTIN